MSLRKRILLMIILVTITVVLGIYILVSVYMRKSFEKISDHNTRNLVEMATLSIKNQYNSLLYHKEYATNLRKAECKNIMELVISLIDKYNQDYQDGRISKTRAKQMAIKLINKFRYDNGNGYFWINDTEKPIPKIIIHPFYPEYNNKLSTAPIFFTSIDSVNIPLLAVKSCELNGSGFIEYYWSKPDDKLKSEKKQKLSYVQLYEPWGWVIGTGVYLEDIEKDAKDRMNAIVDELKNTLGKLKIAETGYFFIFNSRKEILLHPLLVQENVDSALYYSSLSLVNNIIEAEKTENKTFEYNWTRVENTDQTFKYKKKVFVEYYKPLDWYVCASIYKEDLDKPLTGLLKTIFLFSTIFSIVAIIISLFISNSLSRPIRNLMNFVIKAPSDQININIDRVPVSGSKETRLLGLAIKDMLIAIKAHNSKILEEKAKTEESEKKLRQSESKYRTLFNSSGDAVFMFDNFKIIECNERAIKILKGERNNIIGLDLWDISPEFQPDGIKSKEKARMIVKNNVQGDPIEFEWVHKDLNNNLLNIEITLIILDQDRKVMLSTWRDITAKKTAEKALKESEEKYRFLVENSPSVFWIFDKERKLTYLSPNAEKVLGYPFSVIREQWDNVLMLRVHPEDLNDVKIAFFSLFNNGKSFNITYRFKNNKENWIWINNLGEINNTIFGEGVSYGIMTDVTENRLHEQRILQTMIRSEEEERSRIAKDLHDGVSPLLSAIKLFTQSMRDTNEKKIKETLSEKIGDTISEAIRSIHEISANISPHILQNFGLVNAVQSFITHITFSKEISCTINSDIINRLPSDVETTLYRISVELINNTIKYAEARNIVFDFSVKNNYIYMKYNDDGKGFEPGKVLKKSKGMGLFNMMNRVDSLNGTCKIKSGINKGVNVSIILPLVVE